MNTAFNDYKDAFVQRNPRYAVKVPGQTWHTRQMALHDSEIKKHLGQEYSVACLGRWYPEFAALDLDDVPVEKVEQVREGLSLNESNSMLFSSESKDSYHLYFRPQYNGKPPTLNLLQSVLKPYASKNGVEIYPQKNRAFRLPFGRGQRILDFETDGQPWEKSLYWLQKTDEFDLSGVKMHQRQFEFKLNKPLPPDGNALMTGYELLEEGLTRPSSRDESQFVLIQYFFRQNIPQHETASLVWKWIRTKHNGLSKDFLKNPQYVWNHIQHQTARYYGHCQFAFRLPDQTHKSFKGYVCKNDLLDIIELAKGNLPRMRFFFELVRFMNPRRHRRVHVHSDKLVEWSSMRMYQRHLNYLEKKGIVERGSGYLVGEQSKSLKLNWNYRSDKEAVCFAGRSVETLERACCMIFKPAEMRALLRNHVAKSTAQMTVNALFNMYNEKYRYSESEKVQKRHNI